MQSRKRSGFRLYLYSVFVLGCLINPVQIFEAVAHIKTTLKQIAVVIAGALLAITLWPALILHTALSFGATEAKNTNM